MYAFTKNFETRFLENEKIGKQKIVILYVRYIYGLFFIRNSFPVVCTTCTEASCIWHTYNNIYYILDVYIIYVLYMYTNFLVTLHYRRLKQRSSIASNLVAKQFQNTYLYFMTKRRNVSQIVRTS